jgi:nucleotide-binding universal stress UspA family protein
MAAGGAVENGRRSTRAAALAFPPVFRHVVCLTGLSCEGPVPEAHAELLAQACGARLTLYHASDFDDHALDPIRSADVRAAADRLAHATLRGEAQATGVPSPRREIVVERRPPTAATMAAAVRRLGADIVVMAPHGRGTLSRVFGFSLTEATVDALAGALPVLCARGEAHPYRRILVATDFSAGSRRSFRLVARLARVFGATVTVLHTVTGLAEVDGALASLRRFIPRELAGLAPRMVVEAGEPCTVILSTARAMGADLVVLSTRGRDSLRDAVAGTHAQRVIRHAPCPVLVT